IPLSALRNNLAQLSDRHFLNLDTCDGDGTVGIGVADDASESPESSVCRSERRQKLAGVVCDLPERLQRVLKLYYEQDFTFREIGAELGITESRVCQLHGEALLRLRASYLAEDDEHEDLTSIRRRLPDPGEADADRQ